MYQEPNQRLPKGYFARKTVKGKNSNEQNEGYSQHARHPDQSRSFFQSFLSKTNMSILHITYDIFTLSRLFKGFVALHVLG